MRQARHRWAQLLRRIFAVDLLACPRCGEEMRIVAFITQPKVIDRILCDAPCQLADTRALRPDAGRPPSPPPLPNNPLTYPDDHRSGIVGLPGCADHRSDITVHPPSLCVRLDRGTSHCQAERLDSSNSVRHTWDGWIQIPIPTDREPTTAVGVNGRRSNEGCSASTLYNGLSRARAPSYE